MEKTICKSLTKFYDKNGNIIGYRLQDTSGNCKDVPANSIKKAIADGWLDVVNLTLTSDNRLVDAAKEKEHEIVSSLLAAKKDKAVQTTDTTQAIPKIASAEVYRCVMLDISDAFSKEYPNTDSSVIKKALSYFEGKRVDVFRLKNLDLIKYELINVPTNTKRMTVTLAELCRMIKSEEAIVENLKHVDASEYTEELYIYKQIKDASDQYIREILARPYAIMTAIGQEDTKYNISHRTHYQVDIDIDISGLRLTVMERRNYNWVRVVKERGGTKDGVYYRVMYTGDNAGLYDIDRKRDVLIADNADNIKGTITKFVKFVNDKKEVALEEENRKAEIQKAVAAKINVDTSIGYKRGFNEECDIDKMTIDELGKELEEYIDFECGDMGGEEFDDAYYNNKNRFATINNIRNQCIGRGYLTEEQFEMWMTGYDGNDYSMEKRWDQQYHFVDWILLHSKDHKHEAKKRNWRAEALQAIFKP